jgi:hypothetical protein
MKAARKDVSIIDIFGQARARLPFRKRYPCIILNYNIQMIRRGIGFVGK